MTEEKWFSSWFDTPYYHTLYSNRDENEAKRFIDNLVRYLNIDEEGAVLDLACGKGRHSLYLNQLGYNVKGVDLSEKSIAHASQFANDRLTFGVHDMRNLLPDQYDVVLNLFTSFGYFETEEENLNVLKTIQQAISEFGIGVIDFMNVNKVISQMVTDETKHIKGIDFNIKRYILNGFICKEIKFKDQNQDFYYTEKVKIITLSDFENLMEKIGLQILEIFGDYQLSPYNAEKSDRLIMIVK